MDLFIHCKTDKPEIPGMLKVMGGRTFMLTGDEIKMFSSVGLVHHLENISRKGTTSLYLDNCHGNLDL
jgi:hypothetical protein